MVGRGKGDGDPQLACNDLFRSNMAPHNKKNADTLTESLKKDWKKEVLSKYTFPPMTEERMGMIELAPAQAGRSL